MSLSKKDIERLRDYREVITGYISELQEQVRTVNEKIILLRLELDCIDVRLSTDRLDELFSDEESV